MEKDQINGEIHSMLSFKFLRLYTLAGCLVICWSGHKPALGQISQPERFEVDVENSSEDFTIVPAGEEGLLLVRPNPDLFEKNKMSWEFIALDTALNKRRTDLIYIEYGYELRGYDYNDHKIYLLFEMNNNNYADFNFMEYDLLNGEHSITKIKRLLNISLTEFEVLDRKAILGGYINTRPAVVMYSMDEETTKVLPGIYFDKTQLLQLVVSDESKVIRVVTSLQLPGSGNRTINIRSFNSQGELLENSTLQPDDRYSLLTGRVVNVNPTVTLIAGTYGNRKSEYSRGIFLTRIDSEGDKKLIYYDYADLKNFFSYMKARKQAEVRDKIQRKKVHGQRARFYYRLLVHDISEYQGNYILVGEAYYPKYSNNNFYSGYWYSPYYFDYYDLYRNSYNRYNSPYYYRNNFTGYAYTHAVIIGFDKKGNVLWDNSFEIKDVTSDVLQPLVKVSAKPGRLVLLYNFDNKIRTKIIQGDKVMEGKEFDNINLKFREDEVKEDDARLGGLENWYDDTFYAYGIQHIRNASQPGGKLNRKVFFVNKIIYY